jgi:hypothetical protein
MAAELKWVEGRYGGAQTLTLAEGFVRIYVGWALVSRGEEGYYEANVNSTRLTKKFKTVYEAKKASLRVAFKLTGLAHEQIKNFLEE